MNRSIKWICLALSLLPSGLNGQLPIEKLYINVWYGDQQSFGHLGGHPQRWINVLGNVWPAGQIESVEYSLNGDEPKPLDFTANRQRLARPGDINIEILRTDLRDGGNEIVVTAKSRSGEVAQRSINVQYFQENVRWPLPYRIDWSKIDRISDAVQVVDGRWILAERGVRSVEHHYDRVLAFGDDSWANYEVSTSVILHDFTPPKTGPNGTNVTHMAIATRWPGHDPDGQQPTIKWFPLGATAEFRIGSDLQECRWRIFDGERAHLESEKRRSIERERTYRLKHRVETLADGSSRYRVKLWPAAKREPRKWDLERIEPPGDVPSGSALLLAHFTDVTFGDVRVKPLNESQSPMPGWRIRKFLSTRLFGSDES